MKNAIGSPRTEWLSFSKAESQAVIQAVKKRLGPEYTISHLGHAATVLALLKAKPLPPSAPDNTALIMPLPVNGRRFLKAEYADKQYGACQAGAVVEFPNLTSWTVDDSDSEAVKAALDRGCRHVKASYDYWLSKEFQLALGVSKDNFLSAFLSSCVSLPRRSRNFGKMCRLTIHSSSTPMPFTGSSVPVRDISIAPLTHFLPHHPPTTHSFPNLPRSSSATV